MPLWCSLKRLAALNPNRYLPRHIPTTHLRSQWITSHIWQPRSHTSHSTNTESPHENGLSSVSRSAAEYDSYLDLVREDHKPEEHTTAFRRVVNRPQPDGVRNRRRRQGWRFTGHQMKSWREGRRRNTGGKRRRTRASRKSIPRQLSVEQKRGLQRKQANLRGRGILPRYTSLRTILRPSANFSSTWNTGFAKIARGYDKKLTGDNPNYSDVPELEPEAVEWKDAILQKMDNEVDLINMQTFAMQYDKTGREIWAQVALWLLVHDKDRTIDFLLATHTPIYPPMNFVEDCLQHLAEYYDHQQPVNRNDVGRLVEAFCTLADRGEGQGEIMAIRSSFIRLVLPHLPIEQVKQLYRAVKVHRVALHPYSLHHISAHFAKNGHLEQGIDALLEARAAGADTNSVAFRSNCSVLLRQSITHPGGMRMCLRLVDNLTEMGMTLNNQLCNIVMLNAVEAHDFKTALAIFHSLRDQGLNANEYTYAILLKGCKANIDDADTLKETIQGAIANGYVRGDVVVATEVLHCLALHHMKHNPGTAFTTVMNAYVELFDVRPLKLLGLPVPDIQLDELGQEPSTRLMAPSPHAINFVLTAYLEHGRSAKAAVQLYQTWRELAQADSVPFSTLAGTPYTSLIFLRKFIKSKATLIYATQVVKDMQVPFPEDMDATQHPPNVQIWSAFLHGFTIHGQMKLAEQVLGYMREKGIEPNHVTWNTLLGGYAESQDMEGTLDTVRRLEQNSVVWDRFTAGGLRRYRNQLRLKTRLEDMKLEKSMDFTSELREKFEYRLESIQDGEELLTDERVRDEVIQDGEEIHVDEGFRDDENPGMDALEEASRKDERDRYM